jgi:hypothetical protein
MALVGKAGSGRDLRYIHMRCPEQGSRPLDPHYAHIFPDTDTECGSRLSAQMADRAAKSVRDSMQIRLFGAVAMQMFPQAA